MITFLLYALCLVTPAQEPAAPADDPGSVAAHLRAGSYLAALSAAEESLEQERAQNGKGLAPLVYQLAVTQSFVGQVDEAVATVDAHAYKRGRAREDPAFVKAKPHDAVRAIVEASEGRRVVILNEEVHRPRHRAFALELARALRKEGFDTFAAEAFTDAAGTMQRGCPSPETGFYVMDPVFGELVREALELGYRLVDYEYEPGPEVVGLEAIRSREAGRAQNLFDRVLAADPDARLFVLASAESAKEQWIDRGGNVDMAGMAARLADLAGLDPLTIDQTVGVPHSVPDFEDPHWQRAARRKLLREPKVFRLRKKEGFVTGGFAGSADLQVFHPPADHEHGRPDWLASGRTAVRVPAELVESLPDERVLLQAFHAGEGAGAIPADQFVAEGSRKLPRFLLHPGEYRLVVQDVRGQTVASLDGVLVE